MKVNLKYDIGNVVWYISNNKVCSGKVRCAYCTVIESDKTSTGYKITNEYILQGDDLKMNECDLFSTKEELLKSL